MADKPHIGGDDAFERGRSADEVDALPPEDQDTSTEPPVDRRERSDELETDDVIEVPPAEDAGNDSRPRWHTTIDELIPRPREEPFHDDDATGEDPFDARDEVDIHVPPSTGDPADEVDDFSTDEELDVDNAPAGHNPEHDITDPATDRYEESAEAEMTPAREVNEGDTSRATVATGEEVPPAPTTTCPTCGQRTDALRFCGHCGGPLTERRFKVTGDTPVQRLASRIEGYLEPLSHWSRPGGVRAILALGVLLVLLSLLLNSAAMALVIGASILPAVILYWCRRIDVFENEPWYIVAGFAVVGVVVGALLGWLGAITATNAWFETGMLNYGAAGFGGRFAQAAGSAPFIVWLVCGIMVPILAVTAIIAAPLLMRQAIDLRNEVMDGLTLAAAMAGGFSVGSAIVFVAPMFDGPAPAISASAWTLTTIGLTILRPLIWTLSGALLGAAAWRYLLSNSIASSIIPIVAGVGAPLFATLLSIQLAAVGLWAEILLLIAIAIGAGILYRRTLDEAVTHDRRVLGNDNTRIVCPNCHHVTPAGTYCAHCGETLGATAGA